MLPKFTPFNQSLINQGMRQTNKIANNITTPPNINNQQNIISNNNMNQVGGNVMGGEGFGPGSDMLGVGNVAGSGYGGNIGQHDMWGEGTQGHMGFGGSMGGDAYDDYLAEQEEQPYEDQGIFILPGDAGYVISDMYNIYDQFVIDLYTSAYSNVDFTFDTAEDAIATNEYLQSLQELYDSGWWDEDVNYAGEPYDLDLGGMDIGGEGGFSIGGGIDSSYYDGFDWSQFDFGNIHQEEAEEYQGGNQGGNEVYGHFAKKLYYPQLTGGFSAVGSGISDNEDILKQLLEGLG